MKVEDYRVDGRIYQIHLGQDGEFFAAAEDTNVRAPTLALLKKKLTASTRKAAVRIKLPASLALGRGRYSSRDDAVTGFEDVIITGIHQRTGDILIRRVKGNADTVRRWGHGLFKRLTGAQQTHYMKLQAARRKTSDAVDAYETRYQYDEDTIKRAVEAAEQKAGVSDDA